MKTFSVYANPFAALDHEGRPAGACPCDPHEHTPGRQWVGAKLDTELTKVIEKYAPHELRSSPQNTEFAFDTQPVPIPQTAYYRQMIKAGALFPADKATAQAVDMKLKPIDEYMAAAKAQAISDWETNYGEGTCPLSVDAMEKISDSSPHSDRRV